MEINCSRVRQMPHDQSTGVEKPVLMPSMPHDQSTGVEKPVLMPSMFLLAKQLGSEPGYG
jgi:hypothetical protein